jgi:3-dehydroquinate synthase
VLAVGGGVVGDVAGFAAATYLRGLPCVQIPTTLLSQIDSSIGGKTGVNLPSGKNLVGAFHQPQTVIVDPSLLVTLPLREFHSGMFEAVKYGVIRSGALFDLISHKHSLFPRRDRESLEDVIAHCIRLKAEVVSRDETESELRMILNYGHTLGHALESATRYRKLTHGEAIGHGMILANRVAEMLDRLPSDESLRINDLLGRIAPLPRLGGLDWQGVFRRMLSDKKFIDHRLRFVLPSRVGEVHIVKDVPPAIVKSALRRYLNARS